MEKKIIFNGQEYTIEIKWGSESYFLRVVGIGGFHKIPTDCLDDIEKIKPIILEAIENKHDLTIIEKWDGRL